MSKLKIVIASLGAILTVGGFSATAVSAEAVYRSSEESTTSVASDETVDGSAYLAGNNVRVSGTVKGDVYCAGSNITISGTVEGDVLCAGSSVTVDGTVKGDVRLAGATVTLGGVVNGNASLFGATVIADSSLELGGDLTGGASSLTVDGVIGRDLSIGSDSLTINGTVGRDVTGGFTNIEFGDSGKVKGNLTYTSNREATIPNSAVAGETSFTLSSDQTTGTNNVVGPLAALLSVLALGLLAVLGTIVMPRQVHSAADISWGRFGVAVIVGLTFIVVAPVAALMLLATGVGGVIAYALILTWLLVMAVSPVTFAYFLGSKVYGKKTPHVLVRVTIGGLLLMLALLIPVINVIMFIVMVLSGVGMSLLGVPNFYKNSPYQVAEAGAAKKNKAA